MEVQIIFKTVDHEFVEKPLDTLLSMITDAKRSPSEDAGEHFGNGYMETFVTLPKDFSPTILRYAMTTMISETYFEFIDGDYEM